MKGSRSRPSFTRLAVISAWAAVPQGFVPRRSVERNLSRIAFRPILRWSKAREASASSGRIVINIPLIGGMLPARVRKPTAAHWRPACRSHYFAAVIDFGGVGGKCAVVVERWRVVTDCVAGAGAAKIQPPVTFIQIER